MLLIVGATSPIIYVNTDSRKASLQSKLHKSWALVIGLLPFFAIREQDISQNSGQK